MPKDSGVRAMELKCRQETGENGVDGNGIFEALCHHGYSKEGIRVAGNAMVEELEGEKVPGHVLVGGEEKRVVGFICPVPVKKLEDEALKAGDEATGCGEEIQEVYCGERARSEMSVNGREKMTRKGREDQGATMSLF